MNLSYSPEVAIQTLRANDPILGQLIERTGEFALEVSPITSPFEYLARAIIYQQLSGKAAAKIHERVLGLFAESGFTPEELAQRSDDQLRGAGMSAAKVAGLRDLAEKTVAGQLPDLAQLQQMGDAEIVEQLTAVRGVGPWTVEMLLMFRLGRPDVLPASDLGVRKGFMLTYGLAELPKPKAIVQHAERWRPYRTVASWYLWRAVAAHGTSQSPESA